MSETVHLQKNIEGLSYQKPQTWDEVYELWRSGEDNPDHERKYHGLGHADWDSWRQQIIKPLHLEQLQWAQYTVETPATVIPMFHGGPYKPWLDRYYGGATCPTFAEIIAVPGTDIGKRDKFADIIAAARDISLIGLVMAGEIYVIEGMHRCVAVTLATSRNLEMKFNVDISLAQTDLPDLPLVL